MRKFVRNYWIGILATLFVSTMAGLGIYLNVYHESAPTYEFTEVNSGYSFDHTYLLAVHLSDGRAIMILPSGELKFNGDLSEQAVQFWQKLAEGVPAFTEILCAEENP